MKPFTLRTLSADYEIQGIIGQGGAGTVYLAKSGEQTFAVKFLSNNRGTKKKRFANEVAFLKTVQHPNIVPHVESGDWPVGEVTGPFYVMPYYTGNLRSRMKLGIKSDQAMKWIGSMLDGVEASHLSGAIHRDLKPENILCNETPASLAVADFGCASFSEQILWTLVETDPKERLANFQYCAPEQRNKGAILTLAVDIYALGLMMNELFTGEIPAGTNFKRIGDVAPSHSWLDPIIDQMLNQQPDGRPRSINDVKLLLMRYEQEAIQLQKLNSLNRAVIPEGQNPDPLAHTPPKIVNADWSNGTLTLFFDNKLSEGWIQGLLNMGDYTSVHGFDPGSFAYTGNTARIGTRSEDAQRIINHFKDWLPKATRRYKRTWELEQEAKANSQKQQLAIQRKAEEARLKFLKELEL